MLILRSDDIKISQKMPDIPAVNCYRGIVKDIFPSEYGMEITVEAGETFFVDISADTFRQQPLKEMSEVWISFSREAGVALEGLIRRIELGSNATPKGGYNSIKKEFQRLGKRGRKGLGADGEG